jgi:apolipoprotein D and lipocalin family protein
VQGGSWREAEGKAYFIGSPDVGRLKVSFFGPFYGSYNVMALDQEGYQWAMVCGPDTDYLWILSREPKLPEAVLERLLALASARGFETDKLIYVEH